MPAQGPGTYRSSCLSGAYPPYIHSKEIERSAPHVFEKSKLYIVEKVMP